MSETHGLCYFLTGEGRSATVSSFEDAIECAACGTVVVWDMVDHPFFGFKACCPENESPKVTT